MDSQQNSNHDPDLTPPPPPGNGAPTPDEPIDDAQLSPGAWITRHGFTLLLGAASLVAIYYWVGLEGMWTIAKVALGLGAVIFIHELGHFLVAKWCDVHVQTFSIGFGPALPGCSYRWGETTYKIALFPLGGYVKMVGEGGENDEEDTDPRSFKNKTVGQRMAIISAGVVMNVLFGLVTFIIAFNLGVHKTAPVVGVLEAGGPAWQEGLRPGDRFLEVDGVKHPTFEDLRMAVMLSNKGQHVPFVFEAPGREPRPVAIEPRKTKGEKQPYIGLNPPTELRLPAKRDLSQMPAPVLRNSAAAAARVLDLKPGDTLLAATDPISLNPVESPERATTLTDLDRNDPAGDLGQRLLESVGKPFQVTVHRAAAGKDETLTLEPGSGFQFEDAIVGTSDPSAKNPFQTAKLATDPRDPSERHLDDFEFLDRLGRMAGKPIVIQVRRKGAPANAPPVNVFVPPSYHRIIPGLRMEMGSVTALRKGSSAEAQGMKVDDVIVGVMLTDGKESVTFSQTPNDKEQQLDPLRLPFDLRQWAHDRKNVRATVKVRRMKDHNPNVVEEVTGLVWDGAWSDQGSIPLGVTSSLSLSELGFAYQVKAQVAAVVPGSPAEKAGLRAEDFILSWNYKLPPKKAGQEPDFPEKPMNLRPEDNPTGDPDPYWATVFSMMQSVEYDRVKLQVRHKDGSEETVELDLQRDPTWPLLDSTRPRGILLVPYQDRLVLASNLGEGVQMGLRETYRTIVTIYMSLKALLTQRVSAKENLQGPIDIAYIAYKQAETGWGDFLLLLGLISVNLAVVNFLPIPILDGGHMVFLIYEKLRGRPAGESVRLAANWFGLIVLASLMIFVIYLGFSRVILPKITGG